MRKIKIINFGPIGDGFTKNDGFIDISKVTVFIGDQGSGKSTVAKLISIFTWMEKALVKDYVNISQLERKNHFEKNRCEYHNIQNYFHLIGTDKTYIEYRGLKYTFVYQDESFRVNVNSDDVSFALPKVMYVPADRNFVSAISNPSKIKGIANNIFTFLDRYTEALQNSKSAIQLPLKNAHISYDKLNKVASLHISSGKIRLNEASSGFQSLVPMCVTLDYLLSIVNTTSSKNNVDISLDEKQKIQKRITEIQDREDISEEMKWTLINTLAGKTANQCLISIVEEPEQNLYPSSQMVVLYELLRINNDITENRLVVTTHSPYIINYLSLAIKAAELEPRCTTNPVLINRLNEIVPRGSAIESNNVNIYELNDGEIHLLTKSEGLPLDSNLLNNYLDEVTQMFDTLLDIEEICQR